MERSFTPEAFAAEAASVGVAKAVHIEVMPVPDGVAEAEAVEAAVREGVAPVVAQVASCNLAADDARQQLQVLKARAPSVVGIRYILDYAGPFGEAPATHVALSRHNGGSGVDFLRDPAWAHRFEGGFAALADFGLRFDLQCSPAQLDAAAALIGRHPAVPVVLNHLGKPRLGSGPAADAAELAVWRRGVAKLAALPNAYAKLSMLGYAVPRWTEGGDREVLIASLVRETIDAFGPHRCMFASNWWCNGHMANSDGRDDCDISMLGIWQRYFSWVEGKYSEAEIRRLTAGTAEEFYGI